MYFASEHVLYKETYEVCLLLLAISIHINYSGERGAQTKSFALK